MKGKRKTVTVTVTAVVNEEQGGGNRMLLPLPSCLFGLTCLGLSEHVFNLGIGL